MPDTKTDTELAFSADVELDLAPFVFFEERLTQDPVVVLNLRSVNRSPDGSRVVFSALSQIWVMEPPGGQPFPLVQQDFGQFQPVLSPDGSELVYVSWDDLEGGHVWRLPLEGAAAGSPLRLTEYPGYYLHPTWSPDGSKIAFMKEDAAAFRNVWSRNTGLIVWMDARGGPLNTVASAPSDNRLTFSPDGTRISYVAEVSGGRQADSEYVSVRLDGTDRRTAWTPSQTLPPGMMPAPTSSMFPASSSCRESSTCTPTCGRRARCSSRPVGRTSPTSPTASPRRATYRPATFRSPTVSWWSPAGR